VDAIYYELADLLSYIRVGYVTSVFCHFSYSNCLC